MASAPPPSSRLSELHASPAAGFEQPFEMLQACHQRVQRSLALLLRLREHLVTHGADRQAAEAARDVMRYFDIAAPHHHEDEERHVLPRLRAAGEAALADHLHAEHEAMAQGWVPIRAALQQVARGHWDGEAAAAAARDWPAFAQLYAGHLELEESRAFPGSRQQLTANDASAIGAEMAARRGVQVPRRG